MPGFLIAPTVSITAGTGPSLADLASRLADELGFHHATTVSATASAGDPTRVVIADEYRDDEMIEPAGVWLYAADGDQAGVQRRILSQPEVGYQGARGLHLVSRPFAAALEAGTTVRLTSPLPWRRYMGVLGLCEVVNQAQKLIWVPVRLTVTGNGTYEYALTSYPWIEIADVQAREIYDTRWSGITVPAQRSPGAVRLVTNGASRALVTEVLYSTADTFYLDAVVTADRLVYDGSSWGFGTGAGLTADNHRTAAPGQWVHTFAMVKALQQVRKLQRMRPDPDAALQRMRQVEVQSQIDTWARAAYTIMREQFPRAVQARTPSLVSPPVVSGWA